MIITRTPFRISFVGGGTDLPSFYRHDFGQVLSTSINKYIYVVAKKQIGIVEAKYRINWSKVENCDHVDDIEHPIVRVVLAEHDINFPIQISTFSDIPANTGLGSSSSFTVGLLNAIYAIKNIHRSQEQLAEEAAEVEINVLGRTMGKQDHYAAALGGLNIIRFNTDDTVLSTPVVVKREVLAELENNFLLFYTKQKRDASDVLVSQNQKASANFKQLCEMRELVPDLTAVLQEGKNLNLVGKILDQAWQLKRNLAADISSKEIDRLYRTAINAGALGGKILGAGGGGFFLFYVPKDRQKNVREALSGLYSLQVKFESSGACIRYHDPS